MLIRYAQQNIVFFLSKAGAGVLVIAGAVAHTAQGSNMREVGRHHLSVAQAKAFIAELQSRGVHYIIDEALTDAHIEDSVLCLAAARVASEIPTPSPFVFSYFNPSFDTEEAFLSSQKTRGPNC